MADTKHSIRIIALGNSGRGDDASGGIAARRLRTTLAGRARIEEQDGEPGTLIESWRGAELVIVIDAIHAGAPPGTIHRFDARRHGLPIRTKPSSSHDFDLAATIELARALHRLPPRLLVFGIELKGCEIGQPLSREVDRSLERLIGQIEQEVLTFLAPPPP